MFVWSSTERIFQMTKANSIAKEQALVLLRRLAREDPWLSSELHAYSDKAKNGDASDLLAVLEHTQPEIVAQPRDEQARVLLHLMSWMGLLDEKDKVQLVSGGRREH